MAEVRKLFNNLIEEISLRIRRFKKRRRIAAWKKKREAIDLAKGEIITEFDGLLNEIIHKTMREYHEKYRQSFHTVQAQHDIKRTFFEVLQSYIKVK